MLAISHARYLDIRRRVRERANEAAMRTLVAEALASSDSITFKSVDDFMSQVDAATSSHLVRTDQADLPDLDFGQHGQDGRPQNEHSDDDRDGNGVNLSRQRQRR